MVEPNKNVKHFLQGSRMMAVVTGILLVILGVLLLVFPLEAMLFADIFITLGLLLFGIYRVATFIATPSGYRDGWQLASGIIFAVCALVILLSNASSIIVTFAFLLGILAMLTGLNQVFAYSSLRVFPGAGFILAAGIINMLLAIFLLFSPFFATVAMVVVQGIYLCFAGIALIIEGFAKKGLPLD